VQLLIEHLTQSYLTYFKGSHHSGILITIGNLPMLKRSYIYIYRFMNRFINKFMSLKVYVLPIEVPHSQIKIMIVDVFDLMSIKHE